MPRGRGFGLDRSPQREVRLARSRKKQSQKIIDLRHRPDGRARVAACRFLFDGNDGAEARDLLDIGPLHFTDELASVTRQRFHETALAFGVNRVERERRFAAARNACDDDELVARDADIDVFEVVDARADDLDMVLCDVFFHGNGNAEAKLFVEK